MPHSTIEATADAILAEELATREETDAALARLDALAHESVSVVGSPRTVQVWARRSA
jgi:hypothetical protein